MTQETGLLRDLNLKPGDRVTMDEDPYRGIMKVVGVNDSEIYPDHIRLDSDVVGLGLYDDYAGTFTIVSRAPRSIGTLKEIGAKVGDVVKCRDGEFSISQLEIDEFKYNDYTIISRATPSPVRTVTKTEIVPGVYGKVIVDMLGGIGVSVQELHDADELTAAINTLTEIREAL